VKNSADFATVAKGTDKANIIRAPVIAEINFLISFSFLIVKIKFNVRRIPSLK
jgi:hypothetical protein